MHVPRLAHALGQSQLHYGQRLALAVCWKCILKNSLAYIL